MLLVRVILTVVIICHSCNYYLLPKYYIACIELLSYYLQKKVV